MSSRSSVPDQSIPTVDVPVPDGNLEPYYGDHTVTVGRPTVNDTARFNPNTIQRRIGEIVFFQWISPSEKFSIVQAKSAAEPCTPLENGLAVQGETAFPDGGEDEDDDGDWGVLTGCLWEIPTNASDVIHVYSDGFCEGGMRATIYVTDGALSGEPIPDFIKQHRGSGENDGINLHPSYPSSRPNLSSGAIGGIVVGSVIGGLLLVAVAMRLAYRQLRSKRTEELARKVKDQQKAKEMQALFRIL